MDSSPDTEDGRDPVARTRKGPVSGKMIIYISVHCDISPLARGSVSDVTKIPVYGFF